MKHIDWNEWFYYDESSPTCLRWKVDRHSGNDYRITKVRSGDIAGKKSERSTVLLNRRRFKVPRVIWEMLIGNISKGFVIDHIDGNPLNNVISNLRLVTQAENTRNAKKRLDNSSGVTGVSRTYNGRGTYYWTARWEGLDGDGNSKHFSIKKLGEQQAFLLACAYREKMIAELNAQGAGYTEDHGKRLAA